MKVIVVSAHPDDEVLGCGGTLVKHREAGDEIGWLIATNMFEHQGYESQQVSRRQEEIDLVASKLGISQVFKLDHPAASLSDETLCRMIPEIATIFQSFQPEVIYLVNRSDIHTDHNITYKSVMACTKSFRYPYVKKILMYECLSETEFAPPFHDTIFIPNYYVDVSEYIDEKLELMEIYASELGLHPFPRSLDNIKALAHYRGATAGVKYAEAFQLLKYIEK